MEVAENGPSLESLQSDHSRRQTRCLQIPKLVTNMVTVMPTEPSGHRGKRNLLGKEPGVLYGESVAEIRP